MVRFGVTSLFLCLLWMILKEVELMHLMDLASLENPCRGSLSLKWMRAPHTCRHYVICAAGQPIRMPSCPESHVWSDMGRNCVPKWSRWDDCTKVKPKSTPLTRRAAPEITRRLTNGDNENKTSRPMDHKANFGHGHHIDLAWKVQEPNAGKNKNGEMTWKIQQPIQEQVPQSQERNNGQKLDSAHNPQRAHVHIGRKPESESDRHSEKTYINQESNSKHTWHVQIGRSPHQESNKHKQQNPQSRQIQPSEQVTQRRKPHRVDAPHRDQRKEEQASVTSTAVAVRFPSFRPKPTISLHDMERISHIKRAFPNHPCSFQSSQTVIAHPEKCQLYYNCSLSPNLPEWKYSEPLTEECVYPQVFSISQRQCMDYDEVDCGRRKIAKNPCEYRENICRTAHCRPCHIRYGNCEGRQDGFHPFPGKEWTPEYMVCGGERNLQQLKCRDPRPIFSPETYQCEHLKNVPKHHGGLRPVCEGRTDGYYPDESGRCDIYFECSQSQFLGYKKCGGNDIYSPGQARCTSGDVEPPCGNITNNICGGLPDGYYADPYGRCPLYIHCINNNLLGYLKCPFGSYNPYTERCETSAAAAKPCGNLPNPCQYRNDGVYADLANNCIASYTCRKRFMIKVEKCKAGQVFSELIGRCGDINNTPSPCGLAPTCIGKTDGKYSSQLKGCQYYYVCKRERFVKYEKCGWNKGGFYFNPEKQKCDFPMNICGACGTRAETSCGITTTFQ